MLFDSQYVDVDHTFLGRCAGVTVWPVCRCVVYGPVKSTPAYLDLSVTWLEVVENPKGRGTVKNLHRNIESGIYHLVSTRGNIVASRVDVSLPVDQLKSATSLTALLPTTVAERDSITYSARMLYKMESGVVSLPRKLYAMSSVV